MGGGASSGDAYKLRVETHGSSDTFSAPLKSRKGTVICPSDGRDSPDTVGPAMKGRKGPTQISPIQSVEDLDTVPHLSPLKSKQASLARMNSKLPPVHGASASAIDNENGGNFISKSAPSVKNMLIPASSVANLTSTPSQARILRSGSVMGRNVTICSVNYPWLIKNANVTGSHFSDYEMGRVIGKLDEMK